jgi:hypothetical protein
MSYYITRMWDTGATKRIVSDLTLDEAQAHCKDPETSSKTCSSETAAANPGRWFDGYDEA